MEAALHGDGRRATRGGRCRLGRQDEPRRVRHGVLHRELRLRPHPQPPRSRAGARGLERWKRRRGGGRVQRLLARQRHRRLDPPARRALRGRRGQADLRTLGLPLRRGRLRQQPRPGRAVRPHGGRRRGGPRGHRRSRRPGLHVDPTAVAADVGGARPGGRGPPGRADHRSAAGRRPRRGRAARSRLRRAEGSGRHDRRRHGSGLRVRAHRLLPRRSVRGRRATSRVTTVSATACGPTVRPPRT